MTTPTTNDPAEMAPGTRLEGWKEIAAHLRRGVRTVQRWEAKLGMPVHRMAAGRSETVCAFADELERWRATAEGRIASSEPEAAGSEANGDGANETTPAGTANRAGTTSPDRGESQDSSVTSSIARTARRRWMVVAGAGVVVAAVGGWAAWSTLSRPLGPTSTPPPPASAPRPQPASGRVESGVLNIYDSNHQFLWSKGFDFPLHDASSEAAAGLGHIPILCDDLDGDGNVEVLFVSEPGDPSSRGLFCFNHDGTPRFRHQPEPTVTFGPLTAAPPWRAGFVKVVGDPGRPHNIWFVSFHLTEYPTIVEKLDPNGDVHGQYWNDGVVMTVEEGVINGRRVVLVGGTNNEFKGGSLAVLDERAPTGTAPAMAEHYTCRGCPPAPPLAFLVFPRLDTARAIEEYSAVVQILVDRPGQISVQVLNGTTPVMPAEESFALSRSQYTLDAQFRVTKAEIGRRFSVIHRLFEQQKKVGHTYDENRDSAYLWPVRRWDRDGKTVELVTGLEASR